MTPRTTAAIAAAAMILCAVPASASVSVRIECYVSSIGLPTSSCHPDYVHPGDTITLSVYGTANAGETDISLLGPLLYPSQYVDSKFQNPSLTLQQNLLPGFSSAALGCTSARCNVFQQVAPAPSGGSQTDFLISQSEFVIKSTLVLLPPGAPLTMITFLWQTTPTTQDLDWFGLTGANTCAPGGSCPAPGLSIPIHFGIIPEPATAALLGLGLLGLGLAGRRRA